MHRVKSEDLGNYENPTAFHPPIYSLANSRKDCLSKKKILTDSSASMKENIPNLEKLINDIKISPTNTSDNKAVQQIYQSLHQLRDNPQIEDELIAVTHLMKSIEKKILKRTDMKKVKLQKK